eukprot:scaffold169131_cov31-Tisochrysis_lutea.AAC.3
MADRLFTPEPRATQTQYEAWLSMQMTCPLGLVHDPTTRRMTVLATYNANNTDAKRLKDLWRNKSPEETRKILAKPDVEVTNQKDKLITLEQLRNLNDQVMEFCQELSSKQSAIADADGYGPNQC